MGILENATEEEVAQLLFANKGKGKDKLTKKDMAVKLNKQYSYITNLSRKACVLDRVIELELEEVNKDALDSDGRIRLVTKKINECKDADMLRKWIELLHKIDDRASHEEQLNKQIVIVKLPDNGRDK